MLKHHLLLLLFPFLLCACSRNNLEYISFTSWGSVTEVQILDKIITKYENEHPKIKINFIHIPQNYFQKLHLLFASNKAPDVMFINNLYLPVYARQLEDLTNTIDTKDFYPQSVQVLSQNNKLYAVPRDISNLIIYYNEDITGKIEPNWNFEEFKNLIKKTAVNKTFGISYERDIYWASPYIMTLGYNEGIEFYKNLEGKFTPTPSQIGSLTSAQMFLDGKIALYLSGRWMYPKIKECAKFPVGIIVFPGITPADASGWAISKQSKHKKEALKFIKYLSSQENLDYMSETGLIVPARKSCAVKIQEKAFIKAIEQSKPNIVDKNYKKKRDELNKTIWKL